MRLTTAAVLFCLASIPSLTRAQAPPPSTEAVQSQATTVSSSSDIDDYIQGRMQKRHISGVSVAIVQDGKVVLAKGYGVANVELSVPATERTVYQLASVTKTFTATAIMMLVAEGKLGLDDKITERLSDLPAAWEKVTIRHLLNHTSGIKSYTSVRDFFKTSRKDYARREILDLVAKEPLEFAPGEKWSYCNTGYFLLGLVIEKVTGKEYGAFLDERIFKPLGMSQTRVNDLRAVIPDRAQGYEWNGKELRNGEYVSPTQPYAAGMLVSSVSDLIKWDAALGEGKLLKPSTLEPMWTPARLNKGEETGYGFGWQVGKVNGHRLVSHGGGIPGFATELSRFVDDRLTVIVLTNAQGGHAGALARGIAGRLVPALARKPDEPIADADAQTTERLKGVIQGGMRGKVDPELFTEGAKKELVPRVNDGKDQSTEFGALKAFQLLERKPNDRGVHLRYRAIFENDTMNVVFDLDKAGKIAGMGLRPED
jgi:CubicO group peptidase (beta-lactamase class C family)